MESRLVLVIEDDEDTAHRLAAAIREADYEVVVSGGAAAGLDIAIEIRPDCVVCDMDLPDQDGTWVARSIRTHPSPVSVTPFVFLSAYDDAESRLEGFNVGADVYMTKPFRVEEVVAQVGALVQMASRLRQRRDSMLSLNPGASYNTTAIEGDLRQMSIATVLSVLGMERRTGMFEVTSKKRRAQIEIVAGYVVHGTIGGTRVSALAAMRVMLAWKVGRFSFTPLPPCDPPESSRTVQGLLLDAAKAEDEAAASSRPGHLVTGGRHLATSFGGPPSRPDDTGPPSSRALRDAAPISLAFDLLPSRRPEEMPAAEVAAAVDAPISAYEHGIVAPVSEAEAISIHFEDGDGDGVSGEHMLVHESPRPTPPSPFAHASLAAQAAQAARHAAPTPPAGTVLPALRRMQAIMPPPDAGAAATKSLPAPPAPPRPAGAPRPIVVPRAPDKPHDKPRAGHRAAPQKKS
jgi:CheY-like chemotaxis protein